MEIYFLSFLIFFIASQDLFCSDMRDYKTPSAPLQYYENRAMPANQLQQVVNNSCAVLAVPVEETTLVAGIVAQADQEQQAEDNHHSYLRDICRFTAATCRGPIVQCRNELGFVGQACCQPLGACCINTQKRCCYLDDTRCCYVSKNYACPGQMIWPVSDEPDVYCYMQDRTNCLKSIAILPCTFPCVIAGTCALCFE